MSTSGQLNQGVFRARAEQLRELRVGVGADVEHLLVDAHRELGVGVAEEVHRAAGCDAQLGEERGESAAEAVRRQVADGRAELRIRVRVHGLDDVLADVLRCLGIPLPRHEEPAVWRQVELGQVVEQDVVERRHKRDDALAGIGLDAWHDEAAGRQVDVAALESAELGDTETRKNQERDDRRPRDVIPPPLRAVDPDLVAADLAD